MERDCTGSYGHNSEKSELVQFLAFLLLLFWHAHRVGCSAVSSVASLSNLNLSRHVPFSELRRRVVGGELKEAIFSASYSSTYFLSGATAVSDVQHRGAGLKLHGPATCRVTVQAGHVATGHQPTKLAAKLFCGFAADC